MNALKRIALISISMILLVFSFNMNTVNIKAIDQSNVLRIQLLDSGVSEKKVDSLVEKIESGVPLDSMKEEYVNMLPTSEYFVNGYYKAVYVYPDGSVKNLAISGGLFTGTILGGTFTNGGYWYTWTNARVFATWGIVTASFYADFQGATMFGRIDAIRDWGIIVVGGNFTLNDFSIVRKNATSTSRAEARLFFTATATGNFGQATIYLRLYVPYGGLSSAQLAVLN